MLHLQPVRLQLLGIWHLLLHFTADIIVVIEIIFATNVKIALTSMSSTCKSICIIPDNIIGLKTTELGKLTRREFHVRVHSLTKILPHNVCRIHYVFFFHDLASTADLIPQVPLHVSDLLLIGIV